MLLSKLCQGSPEWLEIRKTKITSSDASIINGSNTFNGNSPFKLWRQKMGLEDTDPLNERMAEGSLLEEKARDWFNKEYSSTYKPQVLFHDKEDWIMASLDGWDEASDYILEIKCGAATYDKATKGLVPPYYFDQVQHLLYASGKQRCYYVAYRPDEKPIVITIERDEPFLETLIEKEREFYYFLTKLIPPPLDEKDFREDNDEINIQLANEMREVIEKQSEIKKKYAILKEKLFDRLDDGNCIIPKAGIKIERIVKKGNIDYIKLIKDFKISDIDLEKYRKPEISWLQPKILKEGY